MGGVEGGDSDLVDPANQTDAACRLHDIKYRGTKTSIADRDLILDLQRAVPGTTSEWIYNRLAQLTFGAKDLLRSALHSHDDDPDAQSALDRFMGKGSRAYDQYLQETSGRRNHSYTGNPGDKKNMKTMLKAALSNEAIAKRRERRREARKRRRMRLRELKATLGVPNYAQPQRVKRQRTLAIRRGAIRGGAMLPSGTVGINVRATNREVDPTDVWNYKRVVDRATGMVGIEITGTDFLQNISSGAKAFGDVLVDHLVGPRVIPGSRLKQFARLFTRYRFLDYAVEFQGVSGTTQGGICVGFIDYDPTESISGLDATQKIRKAEAHLGKTDVKLFDGVSTHEFALPNGELLYSPEDGVEPRLTYQGRYFLVVKSGFTVAGNDTASISVRYRVQFFVPELEEEIAVATGYYGVRQSGDAGANTPGYLMSNNAATSAFVEPGSTNTLGVSRSGTEGSVGISMPVILFRPQQSIQQKYYLTTQMQNTVNAGNLGWTVGSSGGTFTSVLQGQLNSASGAVTCGFVTPTSSGVNDEVIIIAASTSYTTKTDSWWWAFPVADSATLEQAAELNYKHLSKAGLLNDVQRLVASALRGLPPAPSKGKEKATSDDDSEEEWLKLCRQKKPLPLIEEEEESVPTRHVKMARHKSLGEGQ
jgi:hypothetical protein